MRHRRHFRRRRPPMQWVTGPAAWGTSTSLTLNVNAPGAQTAFEIVGATGSPAAFDPPTIQRFNVNRILGDLDIFVVAGSQDPQATIVGIGIIVAQVTRAFQPNLVTDAGAPWMFLKHFKLPDPIPGTAGLSNNPPLRVFDLQTGLHPNIDVKVKRTIREGEVLVCCVQAFNAANDSTITVLPYVRALISKVA